MSAIRLARAATGRERVLKFAGAYHGHVDGLLAEAGSGLATQGIPASPGVPAAQAAAQTVVVPGTTRPPCGPRWPSTSCAAILAEPVPGQHGTGSCPGRLPGLSCASRPTPTGHCWFSTR